ncbi:DUF5777 family beta-barrel protein [Marinoscillum sp. MHG1-6]|uniref:DUF5777 family beta-barrel protein n=1 Tax=Marinoscillum sp. MHG1-6 TaxID=2959627 RepID=UPI0021575FFA|nr:DUF5777 family beta-barrel protein [Marinoscillum sp. MHG1-6]
MKTMKPYYQLVLLVAIMFGLGSLPLLAQEEESDAIRPPFESAMLIDNQTTVVYSPKTLEFNIQHRFGTVENGYDDLWGLWAPSNIRLAMSYSPINKLLVGAGLTKFNKVLDLNAKYALLTQTRSGNIPVSVSYYANVGVNTMSKDNFDKGGDRLSYFHQLLISRKVNYWVSIQVAPSMTHFNFVPSESRQNDHFAISGMGRVRVAPALAVVFNVDQAITSHPLDNPNPNLAFGIEMSTSGHSFQIFAGNFGSLVPQYNNVYNSNDFTAGEFLIGFNITRLWNL